MLVWLQLYLGAQTDIVYNNHSEQSLTILIKCGI